VLTFRQLWPNPYCSRGGANAKKENNTNIGKNTKAHTVHYVKYLGFKGLTSRLTQLILRLSLSGIITSTNSQQPRENTQRHTSIRKNLS